MSNPANPLDIFTTYTYHFELYAAIGWDDLVRIGSTNPNVSTTPKRGTLILGAGTSLCLINSRKDAHQIIDDVKFKYLGPSTNDKGHFIPDGSMSFKIYEPNKVFFIEKIAAMMKTLEVYDLTNLNWGLKIYFVGRLPNNEIRTLPELGILIPMNFLEMDSKFTNNGGEYELKFYAVSKFAGSDDDKSISSAMFSGKCNQTIAISAKTVKEALEELAKKLNDNYDDTYKYILRVLPDARKIKYFITIIDKDEIDGELSITGTSTYDSKMVQMTFSPTQSITEWIFTILRSSDKLNKLIGESGKGIRNQGHPGVKFISILPRFLGLTDSLELHYDIHLYRGSDTNVIEFDFLFSSPGKNVDILGFDMHMTSGLVWLQNNLQGSTSQVTNISGSDNKNSSINIQSDIIIKKNIPQGTENKTNPPVNKNDIIYLPLKSPIEETGMVKYKPEALNGAKLMFNTVNQMHSAFEPQVHLTIRGNFDLLAEGIIYPKNYIGQLHELPFGINSPKWVKVNVKSPNDDDSPFFYTGLYWVSSMESQFINGKFTQSLVIMMMNDVIKNSIDKDKKQLSDINLKYSQKPKTNIHQQSSTPRG